MRVRTAAFTAFTTVVFIGCATVPPVKEQSWLRARSDHFEILSSAPRALTTRLARDLERFRVFLQRARGVERLSDGPTRVILFGDGATFSKFRRHKATQGYMSWSGEGHWLVVKGEEYEAASSIAFHEFVHLAEYQGGGRGRPPWYREGLAEFFSTVRFKRGSVEIGRPLFSRKRWLERGNPLPLRRVVTANDVMDWNDTDLQTFYAQSWALVHFLYMAHLVEGPDRREAAQRYLERLRDGENLVDAFEAAFGGSIEEFEPALLGYLARGQMSWMREPLTVSDAALAVSVQPLGRFEQLEMLGDLSFQLGEDNWHRAESLYRSALELRPESQRVQTGLARVLARRGDAEAPEWLARLDLSASREPTVLGRAADAWRALSRSTTGESEACRTAERLYERSLEVEPDRVASLYGWARCLRQNREQLEQSIVLLQRAHEVAPYDPSVALALATRRATLGEFDEARRLLRAAARASHATRDHPSLARELARVSAELGGGPPGPIATRHLSARLEVDTPKPGAALRTLLPFMEVTGRAGLSESLLFDVVIAIDQSGSTLAASGMDVDQDGELGTSVRTVYDELFPSSDPGDSIQVAELIAATRLAMQLHPETTRLSLIGFGAKPKLLAPLGPPADALAALARLRKAGLAYQKDGTSLGNALVAASDQFVRHREPLLRRERIIVLFSDGVVTYPNYRKGREHALEVARELGSFGVRIHAYVIGNLVAMNDDTYPQLARLTNGRYVPISDSRDVIARLSNLRLTGLRDIEIRNLRLGRDARAVRVLADGSFDALIELVPGQNEIEIVANVQDREPLRELRRVDYEPPRVATSRDREAARTFLERLSERGVEVDVRAEIERSRGSHRMERRLEIESLGEDTKEGAGDGFP